MLKSVHWEASSFMRADRTKALGAFSNVANAFKSSGHDRCRPECWLEHSNSSKQRGMLGLSTQNAIGRIWLLETVPWSRSFRTLLYTPWMRRGSWGMAPLILSLNTSWRFIRLTLELLCYRGSTQPLTEQVAVGTPGTVLPCPAIELRFFGLPARSLASEWLAPNREHAAVCMERVLWQTAFGLPFKAERRNCEAALHTCHCTCERTFEGEESQYRDSDTCY
jgi:hypothetical protein